MYPRHESLKATRRLLHICHAVCRRDLKRLSVGEHVARCHHRPDARTYAARLRSSLSTAAAGSPPRSSGVFPETQRASAEIGHGDGKSEGGSSEAASPKEKAEQREGIFSKHGGKMVLGFIGALGLWFLRSQLGNKKLDALKDEVEAACPLEPEEVEELRCVNDYPPPTFRKVLDSVKKAFPTGRATYPEFVRHVAASGALPEPIRFGHLLDRVVLAAAAHRGLLGAAARGEPTPMLPEKGRDIDSGGRDSSVGVAEVGSSTGWAGWDGGAGGAGETSAEELDLDFLMVTFSAAVNTRPSERIRQMWELAQECSRGHQPGQGTAVDGEESEESIPASSAAKMVAMLMAAQQLPAGKYAVKDATHVWPVQHYKLASGRDVLLKGLTDLHEEQEKRTKGWLERKLAPAYDPATEEHISYELFEKILRSGPVCAWGECYAGRRRNKL